MVKESSDREDMARKPAWLEALLSETFFVTCEVHPNEKKNEKNIFCLICCQSFCPHCLPSHHSHPLLQVRRYVYQDVIRLEELKKLIGCSYIQPYTINGAKAIFLKEREQARCSNIKGPGNNTCFTCERILQEPFHFCSLSCKVDHMVYQGEDVSRINRFDESEYHFSQFQGVQNARKNSSIEDPLHDCQASSCSTHDRDNFSGFSQQIMLSLNNRRKGAPRRSPLV